MWQIISLPGCGLNRPLRLGAQTGNYQLVKQLVFPCSIYKMHIHPQALSSLSGALYTSRFSPSSTSTSSVSPALVPCLMSLVSFYLPFDSSSSPSRFSSVSATSGCCSEGHSPEQGWSLSRWYYTPFLHKTCLSCRCWLYRFQKRRRNDRRHSLLHWPWLGGPALSSKNAKVAEILFRPAMG